MAQTVNGGNIRFGVGFDVDQSSLKKLQDSLFKIQTMKFDSNFKGTRDELKQVQQTATRVQEALQKAFNVNLGSLNIEKFNKALGDLKIDKIYQDFSKAGIQGQTAFSQMTSQVLNTNLKLRQTKSIVDSLGQTFLNSVKWNIASSAINAISGSINQAFGYVKNLDSSLTNIRIVTGDSREQMAQFAVEANKAAAALGRTTREYTDAALSFYQQGLNDEEVRVRTEASLKAKNITQGQASVDELTAVWNGYQVSIEQTQKYVDKLAAVADSSASDMSQLATAMSKVAATANVMGVDIDQLTAQIATIVATTRQAPQTVGNALKTIYARINDIKAGTDEAEVSLGNYTGKMAQLGINVLDTNGQLRDTGSVMEEIGERWGTLTREQQVYLAQTMAGQRQYNQLISLFDNWTQYSEMLNVSLESEGTLNEKNARYMESLAAHMEQFTAARQNLMDSLLNADSMKNFVDLGTNIVNVLAKIVDTAGGGGNAILAIGSALTTLFHRQIGNEINNVIVGFQDIRHNVELLNQQAQSVQLFGRSQGYNNQAVKSMVDAHREMAQWSSVLTNSQREQYNELVKQLGEAQDTLSIEQKRVEEAKKLEQILTKTTGDSAEGLLSITETIEKTQNILTSTKSGTQAFEPISKDSFNSVEQLILNIKELNRITGNTSTQAQQFNNKWSTGIRYTKDEIIQLRQEAANFLNIANGQADNLANYFENQGRAAQQAKLKVELYEKQVKQAQDDAKQLWNTQAIVSMVGALGQMVTMVTAFSNGVKSILDPTKTLGEKISSIASILAFTIPQALNIYKNTIGLLITKGTASLKIKQQELIAQKKITLEKAKQAALQKANELDISFDDKVGRWRKNGTGAFASGKEMAPFIKNVQDASDEVQKLEGQSISAFDGLKASLSSFGAKFSTLMAPPAGLVIIGLAAAAAGAYGFYKWYNKDAEAAEKAAKAAKQANEHYKELKDTFNEFNNSISAYDDAVDALSKLNKGTEQWNQKLKETNEQVLQLLDKYPQLAGAISQNADGLLTIDKNSEAYSSYLRDLNRQTQVANVARLGTQQKSNEADRTSQITNLSRSTDINRSDLDKVINAMQHQGNAIIGDTRKLEEILGAGSPSIKAIQENVDKITNLATTIENNTKATQILGTTISQDLLKGVSEYEDSDYQSQFSDQVSKRLANAEFDSVAYSLENGGDDPAKIAQRYSEILGTEVKRTLFGNTYKIFDQQTGQWKKVTADFVKNEIAAADAMRDLDSIIQQTDNEIKQLSQSYKTQSQMAAALQFQGIESEADLQNVDLRKMSFNAVDALDADTLAGVYGWSEELKEAVKNKLEESKQQTKDIAEQYTNTLDRGIKLAFREMDTDTMSGQVQTQVAGILKKVFVAGEGVSGYEKEVAESLQSAIDADKLEELLNQNWDQINLDEAADLFKQLGIEAPKSQQALKAFIDALKTSVQELTAEEIYNNIHGILDKKSGKTLKQGDTISEENYQTLIDSGVEVDGFFRRWIDGTYKLIGDAEEFYKVANSASLQPFYDQIARLKEQVAKGTQFNYDDLAGAAYNEKARSQQQAANSIDRDKAQEQIDALKTIGALTEEQYAHYNSLINDSNAPIGQLIEALQQVNTEIEENKKQLEDYHSVAEQQLHEEQLTVAYGQQDIGELRDARNREDQPFDTLSAEEYAQAVLYASEAEGIQIQNVKTLVNLFSEQADTLDWVNDTLDEDSQAMYNVAAMMEDMVSGIQSIQKSWKQTIKEGVQPSAQVITETAESLSDMFNQDIDASFVEDHLNEIRALAQGDIDAVTDIGIALANAQLDNLEVPAGINKEQFYQDIDNLQLELLNASDYLNDLEIGTSIDDAPFYDALQQMIIQAGMTEEQANELLAGIGYDPKIQYQTVELGDDRLTKTEGGYKYHIDDGNNGGAGTDVELTEEMVSELTSGGQIRIPVIRGSKFAGGGKNLRNAGGSRVTPKAPSGGKGGGGKKGGGGGKGSQPKKPKQEKTKQDKTDPYHMVNRSLDEQQKKLKQIQQLEKDGLLKDKLKAIQDQNKNYEQQIKLLKQKEAIADAEQARLKNEIKAGSSNVKVNFTATGEIANYNQVLDGALKKYNDWITNVYNKWSAEEQQAHAAQKQAREKEYEQLKKNMEEYEKNLDLHKDIAEALRQIKREQTELYLNAMKYNLDAKKNAGELLRNWQDFSDKVIRNIADDDYMSQIQSRFSKIQSYINSEQTKLRSEQIKALQSELDRALAGEATEHTADEIQKRLEQLYKEQMDDLEAIRDLQNEIQEQFLDSLDNVGDKFEKVIDQYERINDVLEYGTDLTRKLYGDQAYNQLNKFSDQLYQNNLKTLQTLNAQKQYWANEMNNSEVGSEAWNRAREFYEDVSDQLNDKILDTLDNLNDWWDSQIEQMADKLTRALSQGFNDGMINADWDRIGKMDDKFLDAVNRTYGVGEIEDMYQAGVDSLADSPKLQQRLNKLMKEQMGILNEKDKLTQYDLDRAKALYDIQMKRYELEEARNNKTKMRLRRDSQGNYTYQYVEDEQKLDDLQSALDKAQNDLYNNDKEQYRKNLDEMYDVYQDYLKDRGELAEQQRQLEAQLAKATTEEEKAEIQERLKAVQDSTEALDQWFEQYYSGLQKNNEWLKDRYLPQSISMNLDLDLDSMSEDEKKKLTDTYVSFAHSLKQGFVQGITDEGGIVAAVINPVTQSMRSMTDAYLTKVDQIMSNASSVGQQLEDSKILLGFDIQQAQTAVETFNNVKDVLKDINNYLSNLDWENYIAQLKDVSDTLLRTYTMVDKATEKSTTGQLNEINEGQITDLHVQGSGTDKIGKDIGDAAAGAISDAAMTGSISNAGASISADAAANAAARQQTAMGAVTGLFSGLGSLINHGTIEQHVQITANFPNATDQNAIEAAILNVVNIASQKGSSSYTETWGTGA